MAAAHSVDEVKDIRDKAAAMQAYGRMAKDRSLETMAAEIRRRAERRMGEMIKEKQASGEMRVRGGLQGTKITLGDIGLNKNQAWRFKKLASMTETEFEASLVVQENSHKEYFAKQKPRSRHERDLWALHDLWECCCETARYAFLEELSLMLRKVA